MSQASEWADDDRGKAWVELWCLIGLLERWRGARDVPFYLLRDVARIAERLGIYGTNALWWDELATDDAESRAA